MSRNQIPVQLDNDLRSILSRVYVLQTQDRVVFPLPISYNAASIWVEWQNVGDTNVFVSPHHTIDILWKYWIYERSAEDDEEGNIEKGEKLKLWEFFGCFTQEGIDAVKEQNNKIIEANTPEMNEASTTLDTGVNTRKRGIDRPEKPSKKIKTISERHLRYLTEMNADIKSDLVEDWWIDYYINMNPYRIQAIKEEFTAFMTGADKSRDIFAFIPIVLRNVKSHSWNYQSERPSSKLRLSAHANGILLVMRPDGKQWLVHVEPDKPCDANKANMLRRSIIALSKMMFGFGNEDRILTINYPLPQVYTRDRNCLYWTRYITRQLIHFFKTSRQINANSTREQAQTAMNSYVAGLSNWKEKLPILIESYKKRTVVPTMKRAFDVVLVAQAAGTNYPILGNPALSLEDRIKLGSVALGSKLLFDENQLLAKPPGERIALINAEYNKLPANGWAATFKEDGDIALNVLSAINQYRLGGYKTRKQRRRRGRFRTRKQTHEVGAV